MKHRRRLLKRLLIAALIIVIGWPLLAWAGAKWLIVNRQIDSPDAIVILSGPGTYIERSEWAARLYRQRRTLVVVSNEGLLSGWSATDERNLYFSELATRRLLQHGVDAQDVRVVSEIGAGTYPESLRLCDYAASQKFNRILVVTSAYHSRRALWSIQRACKDEPIQIGMDSPLPGWQTPAPGLWWLRRTGWRFVGAEYVKLVYYRLYY